MSGHAVGLAAVAAAAVVSAASDRLRCSVVAFAAEPLVLLERNRARPAGAVVNDLLSLRGHGVTDLARALRVAGQLLEGVAPGGRTVLLMSDALHTAGADPLAQWPAWTACTCSAPARRPMPWQPGARSPGADTAAFWRPPGWLS